MFLDESLYVSAWAGLSQEDTVKGLITAACRDGDSMRWSLYGCLMKTTNEGTYIYID